MIDVNRSLCIINQSALIHLNTSVILSKVIQTQSQTYMNKCKESNKTPPVCV